MNDTKHIVTIGEYFKQGTFVVPNYQRGYKWGVPDKNGKCAVSVLMDDLIKAFKNEAKEYFIQGVTVWETEDKTEITLIDGQQRTTTFYFLLELLGMSDLTKINYTVRDESNKYLNGEKVSENVQDIFYFKKAKNTISEKLTEVDKEAFNTFVLNQVKLFYIQVNEQKATKVFSMMNGNKAIMSDEELIKAKLLSKASSETKSCVSEWENNQLRNRYAREWDKWLYWWNQKEVKAFWGSGNTPLGLLLEYYFLSNQSDKNNIYNYTNFDEEFFKNVKKAKECFYGLRALQKTFEDWYNHHETYNYWGLILKGGRNKKEAILHFIKKNEIEEIKDYAKWMLVGATHNEIINPKTLKEDESTKEGRAEEMINQLEESNVYGKYNEIASKQLLRRNVELDNKLKRKFDFELFGEKSLEHIYPKSWENEEDTKLIFKEKDKYSVHCIGNLVLLDKNTNSSFSNNDFKAKKVNYFNTNNVKWSLKLLHSVSVFTKSDWKEAEIEKNKKEFIEELEVTYQIKSSSYE